MLPPEAEKKMRRKMNELWIGVGGNLTKAREPLHAFDINNIRNEISGSWKERYVEYSHRKDKGHENKSHLHQIKK